MANFSVNRVNQFYVVNKVAADDDKDANGHLKKDGTVKAGTILPVYNATYNDLRFEYMSPGGVITTDRIELDKIMWNKKVDALAPSQVRPLKKVKLTFLADTNVLPNETYTAIMNIGHWIGIDERDKYVIVASVYGGEVTGAELNPGDDLGGTEAIEAKQKSELLYRLAVSFARNMSKDPIPLFDIYLSTDGSALSAKVEVGAISPSVEAAGAATAYTAGYTSIIFKERIDATYERGIGTDYDPIRLELSAKKITQNSAEVKWAAIEDVTPVPSLNADNSKPDNYVAPAKASVFGAGATMANASYYGNGRVVSDMEYFFMGERGDQERHAHWPNYVKTEYLVDNPDSTIFDMLNIHFYRTLPNEAVQKSEKDITLVFPHFDAGGDDAGIMTALVSAVSTATSAKLAL